jgi:hypothetical protein
MAEDVAGAYAALERARAALDRVSGHVDESRTALALLEAARDGRLLSLAVGRRSERGPMTRIGATEPEASEGFHDPATGGYAEAPQPAPPAKDPTS